MIFLFISRILHDCLSFFVGNGFGFRKLAEEMKILTAKDGLGSFDL